MAEINTDDFKPNSHQYNKDAEKVETEKKVEKIVTEPVVRKKKTFGRKLADIFIAEDVGDVKSYLVYDVLVPAVKENIADAINGAIGMIFFGEVSRRSANRNNNRNNSRVNYGGYFNGNGNDRRERMPKSYREEGNGRTRTDDIIISNRADAEQVLDELFELLDTYKQVTVADFYDMVGISSEFTDNKYGWTDLRGARVVRVRNGYRIDLPRETAL
jgi:hypothetical protein